MGSPAKIIRRVNIAPMLYMIRIMVCRMILVMIVL